jgi:hypothetical protein
MGIFEHTVIKTCKYVLTNFMAELKEEAFSFTSISLPGP